MDSFSLGNILKIVSEFGTIGLIILLWWFDNKRIWQVIEEHKKDMATVMGQYQKDMAEQREMYRSSASLCRDFSSIASDLRDIVTLNIQTMTRVDDAVRQNQFCPIMRIRKEKSISMVPGQEGG